MKPGRYKMATIEIYRIQVEDGITGLYEETWETELTVEIQTPFGSQDFTTFAHCQYSQATKSPTGLARRFDLVVRNTVKECLTLLRSTMGK